MTVTRHDHFVRGVILEIQPAEILQAIRVGTYWHDSSVQYGARDKLGRPAGDAHRRDHIRGAAGEIVFARFLGVPYDERGALDVFNTRPDVDVYNVRTAREGGHCLIVRPPENDTPHPGRFALVRHLGDRHFEVAGWMHTDEIRTPRFWRPDRGEPFAYWVPAAMLHPFTRTTAGSLSR